MNFKTLFLVDIKNICYKKQFYIENEKEKNGL